MIDSPLIFANQKVAEKFKFEILAWTWKDDWLPVSLIRISLKILNLNFSLDMERWLIPSNIANQ